MKKLFLSLVALICATVSFAQSQIATLTHGDEIKTFYGAGSFKEAMEAANHGDIITLSSGTFESADITKAVTLRGAGMLEVSDETGFYQPTKITSSDVSTNVHINIEDNSDNTLHMEGVKFGSIVYIQSALNNPTFVKCSFGSIFDNGQIKNATFLNCRVNSSFMLGDGSTATCINSVVNRPYKNENNVNTSFEFINCIITGIRNCGTTNNSGNFYLTYSTFRNCYLVFDRNFEKHSVSDVYYYGIALSANNSVIYCCSSLSNAFDNIINTTNKVVFTSDMFDSYDGTSYNDAQKFILKEEAASTYLGDDGTQIGIYGGSMPYNERISMPRITKCNVANKSTADGKLSVDIQVEAAQ